MSISHHPRAPTPAHALLSSTNTSVSRSSSFLLTVPPHSTSSPPEAAILPQARPKLRQPSKPTPFSQNKRPCPAFPVVVVSSDHHQPIHLALRFVCSASAPFHPRPSHPLFDLIGAFPSPLATPLCSPPGRPTAQVAIHPSLSRIELRASSSRIPTSALSNSANVCHTSFSCPSLSLVSSLSLSLSLGWCRCRCRFPPLLSRLTNPPPHVQAHAGTTCTPCPMLAVTHPLPRFP